MTEHSPRARLLELAERVGQGTGGDRELEVQIVYALHPNIGPYEGQCVGDEPIFWHEPYRKQPCPDFLTSLDAALSLVPEGWRWSLRKMPLSNFMASLFVIAPNGSNRPYVPDTLTQVQASTPARALTAACLRAYAAMLIDEEKK